ncbi:IucA/IucC family protein [Natrinema salsiterrestre]|uniref:IucA/IucC family siderophore biosynthesis protein n=1 Tax=Natrinema salsiterrestre TaxID=2950540 RepID=A0A9Q4Q053_9EURY|nr:IucA/IucC family protein [Natrinema salsiterrestre]MDF9745364.1 IucA/IucC family siderophore biosynthesis protein [Natrinema salsiterrestre]
MTETNRSDRGPLVTAAERAAFGVATRYARTNDLATPAERAYLEALEESRREILHRFVRGLLRGDPIGLPDVRFVPLESSAAPVLPDEPAPLSALEGDRLESIVASLPEECRHVAFIPLPASGSALCAGIAATHGYDRVRLTGPVSRWSPTATALERVSHPVDLVPPLECEGAFSDAAQAERIRAEVAESVANLALARLGAAVQARGVPDDGSKSPLEAIPTRISAAAAAASFERIVTGGHPFHPSGKIRRGMTPSDGLAYAPEFTDRIDLRFVAIDRAYALETRTPGSDSMTGRLFGAFDGLEDALERAVPATRDPSEYAVVPVHPLQYHRTVPDRYARQRADGRVVPIPEYARPATPQLNLRTVVPYETDRTGDDPLPHCKLAIPVQTTNVVRTLSPQAVANGPRVTAVLRAIERRESFERLGLLAEPAATCYYPSGGPHTSGAAFDDARHLSGLVRTPPEAHPLVTAGTIPIAASSLVADSPASGRPLVCDLIDRYGANAATGTARAALEFVADYARVVVPEQLRLLCAYGIALESHLQNSLIVFDVDDARPVATLVRDLGGIRVHRGRLAEHGVSLEPYPESDLDADGSDALYRKLYYALFQNHLAELVATIGHESGVDERACWRLIREQCDRAFERIRADADVLESRIRRDERALFGERAVHKALTAMRLRGKRHEYVTSDVSNPLSPAGRNRIDVPE